ncbi:MAG: PspC domain-containing protein [Candidatus Dormibacteraeota bacterium]|nr:PspC domain-containing protein [Candidatus Dormibacteraeota bacterium]
MQPPGNQSFHRGTDRIIGGVCSGLAEGFHVDVLWVRVAFVLLSFVQGVGFILYVVLWFLMPERTGHRPAGQTVFESMKYDTKRAWADLQAQFRGLRPTTSSAAPGAGPTPTGAIHEASPSGEASPAIPSAPHTTTRNPSFVLGAIFIAIGIAFLAVNTHLVDWSVIWPVALVALGIALLVRNLETRS